MFDFSEKFVVDDSARIRVFVIFASVFASFISLDCLDKSVWIND